MQAGSVDRKRLAAVLELLSSDQPGERQAAAEAAHRLVRAAGVQWGDVLVGEPARPAAPPRPALNPSWQHLAAICRRHRELLSDWEREFTASVVLQGRVSPKQYAVLARIAGRCRS